MASNERYIGERALQLAIVYLTRRPDFTVLVEHASNGRRYDLQVQFATDTGERLTFAVEIKGMLDLRLQEDSPTIALPFKRQLDALVQSLPMQMPVYLFLLSMRTDEGYYALLNDGTVHSGASFATNGQHSLQFRKLDGKALDDIVEQVTHWYASLPKTA